MKNVSAISLIALLAAVLCIGSVVPVFAGGLEQKAAITTDAQEEETPYDEEEYRMLMAAINEPDLAKRGPQFLNFLQKYPKTTLIQHVNLGYMALLKECDSKKNYELLQSHAEKWLQLHPGDRDTLAFIVVATKELKNYRRCAECYEEIYAKEPSGDLAKEIFFLYQTSNNLAKQIEWFEKLSKMHQFDTDYGLRWYFVRKYVESKNIPRAAEYAQLTLKSADLAKPPSDAQDELKKIRQVSYHVIGADLLEKEKYPEAIVTFEKAVSIERYSDGYYLIGKCLDIQAIAAKSQDKAEEAMNAYAKAELLGGDNTQKAKERIIEIYKAMHNKTTIGIDKVYKRAKEELGIK